MIQFLSRILGKLKIYTTANTCAHPLETRRKSNVQDVQKILWMYLDTGRKLSIHKTPRRLPFVMLCAKCNTPPYHRCFSRFLNCKNGTELAKHHIWRSYVLWTSYVHPIYVLCLRGCMYVKYMKYNLQKIH